MMSQKYKNFAKGCGSDCNTSLPPDVKRVGYLRKLKKMKRRFFVLHLESMAGDARLEYYSSEKKWKAGSEPRRSIELKSCLNISRKLHSKQKNVIALYTQDDCFAVVADSPEELELWLEDMLEVLRTYASDEKSTPIFEHLWQVEIDKHDLECSQTLIGPYRVALSSKSLTLIKMSPSSDFVYLEFPLMSIRRCGHSKDHFFIELGRSAVTGAGEIYMATEGTIIAQNMHETVLSAMKSSKVREDGNPLPRPRSASTSENSNPVATRRPVGVVTPQTLSSASSNTLSNSRERCDSLPTRPKTLSENPHNCVFSVLSSPHSSSGIACRRLSSRPHSMYEWPSFNSPSTRITSPFSLSSNGGYASSSEDVDSIRQSSSFHSQTMDGSLHSDLPLTEVPDEYLMMSPSEENKPETTGYMLMKQNENTSSNVINYIDMKSTNSKSEGSVSNIKKTDNYMSMAPGGTNEETPVVMQDGYLDMSPSSKSYLQNFNDINSLERNKSKISIDQNAKMEKSGQGHFVLEKVPSLLKNTEDEKIILPLKEKKCTSNVERKNINQTLSSHSFFDNQLKSNDIQFKQTLLKENENLTVKLPIPEKTYKTDNKCTTHPPIPVRRGESRINANILQKQKSENFNCKLKTNKNELCKIIPEIQDLSQCLQIEENSVFEDQDVFPESNIQVNLAHSNKISPSDQNTNFSCLIHTERSMNNMLPCASMCSAHQIPLKQSTMACNQAEQKQSLLKHTDSSNKFKCLESLSLLKNNSKILSTNQNSVSHSSQSLPAAKNNINLSASDDENILHSCGDYVNLEFKTCGSLNLPQSTPTNLAMKTNYLLNNPQFDVNYTNIQFGKPFCPTPNPIPATCDILPFNSSTKTERNSKSSDLSVIQSVNNNSMFVVPEDPRGSKMHHSTTSTDKCVALPCKIRNIPNTLPAFRKQMSAPAAPPSLRPELPSPGRKSSCPVTASASMVKPSQPTTTTASARQGAYHFPSSATGHLRVSISRSPDHSSVSSISSASDEISSNHSSPKTLNASQNFGVAKYHSDVHYENVVIPQRPATSRPSSVSSEKELNYASLDLTPSTRDDIPRSPTGQKPTSAGKAESLLYAEIDFTKSEGLKNTSGIIREGRL